MISAACVMGAASMGLVMACSMCEMASVLFQDLPMWTEVANIQVEKIL